VRSSLFPMQFHFIAVALILTLTECDAWYWLFLDSIDIDGLENKLTRHFSL
jgi:hypothetical protein